MDIKEIILRISKLRQREKLSARALSLEIGMNPAYINMLETKGFEPSLSCLFKIIEACHSTPEEFFYGSIEDYEGDKKTIDYLKKLSLSQKTAIRNLYDEK